MEPNTFFPIPASVVFAKRGNEIGDATPLAGDVERWLGKPGPNADRLARSTIVDTSAQGGSPYANLTRRGADIYPRTLMLIEET